MKREPFAQRLAKLMDQAGLSQSDLAREAKLPRQTVSKFLLGQRQPSLACVLALAKALNVSLSAFDGVKTDA